MRPALFACALLCALAAPARADVEDTLNARWRGGWALTSVPLQSDCGGFYTDNDVAGTQVQSRGSRRFGAGELVRVERIDVKRSRLDLFLDLGEPVLEPLRDGPFTLYEERRCLDFTPEAFERLQEIKLMADAKTNAEVVRNAIRLYDWFLRQQRDQYKFQLVKNEKVKEVELVF